MWGTMESGTFLSMFKICAQLKVITRKGKQEMGTPPGILSLCRKGNSHFGAGPAADGQGTSKGCLLNAEHKLGLGNVLAGVPERFQLQPKERAL